MKMTSFGNWLLGCDRIALDCYQDVYMSLGIAKSIPASAPFSYMETGFSPATFRRGIPLTKLGQQINPFPLIQLPYHRLAGLRQKTSQKSLKPMRDLSFTSTPLKWLKPRYIKKIDEST
jgi:hypothetical protein